MNILGINAFHGNASAAIVCDGQLVAAVEEERFNRVKYAAGFPVAAIQYCLDTAGLKITEVIMWRYREIRGRASGQNFCTRCACRVLRANA